MSVADLVVYNFLQYQLAYGIILVEKIFLKIAGK
jgi:hypothetical protein